MEARRRESGRHRSGESHYLPSSIDCTQSYLGMGYPLAQATARYLWYLHSDSFNPLIT